MQDGKHHTDSWVPMSHCGPRSALAVIRSEFHSEALSYNYFPAPLSKRRTWRIDVLLPGPKSLMGHKLFDEHRPVYFVRVIWIQLGL